MSSDPLTSKYARLRQELAEAYSASIWHTEHIDRLADELAGVERELAGAALLHERVSEPVHGVTSQV